MKRAREEEEEEGEEGEKENLSGSVNRSRDEATPKRRRWVVVKKKITKLVQSLLTNFFIVPHPKRLAEPTATLPAGE
jgi:hypothetical protein